jgi:hypothetical protein
MKYLLTFVFVATCLAFSWYNLHTTNISDTSRPVATTTGDKAVAAKAESNQTSPHLDRFRLGKDCALCHSNSPRATAMRDARGNDIGPYDLWQSSMMANSSRDPYWRAVVSAEVAATPSLKAQIEEECTRCHTPMAGSAPESPPGQILAHIAGNDMRAQLGMDGVSCTVCHQITDQGLGTDASFTGHFVIGDERKIFGPHAQPFPRPMQMHVNYTPTHAPHVLKSALCATCHTLLTDGVDASGNVVAKDFHEQAPYLELRNSDFNDERENAGDRAQSCQACHMPAVDADGNAIRTRLAHNPAGRDFPFLQPRQPFGQHLFLGGNTFMMTILRDHYRKLNVAAPQEAFNRSIEATRDFLGKQTAKIEIVSAERIDDSGQTRLAIKLQVENLAGHKLPTAYPSRRAWIELVVENSSGQVIVASGLTNAQGELMDGQGKTLPSELPGEPVLPHFDRINKPEQVQCYETIMGGPEGNPTFTLLRGTTYLKDNRLLPKGWRSDHPDGPRTQPYGVDGDENFLDGRDDVTFDLTIDNESANQRPLKIRAALRFQSIAPRHAHELFQHATPEVKTFRTMYEDADLTPETLAETSRELK